MLTLLGTRCVALGKAPTLSGSQCFLHNKVWRWPGPGCHNGRDSLSRPSWWGEEVRLELERWLRGFPLSQGAAGPPSPRADPTPTPARPPIRASLRVTATCCGSGRRCPTPSSTMAVWASTQTGPMRRWWCTATSRSWARSCTPRICGPRSTCRRWGRGCGRGQLSGRNWCPGLPAGGGVALWAGLCGGRVCKGRSWGRLALDLWIPRP